MFLEYKGDSAPQSWLGCRVCRDNPRGGACKRTTFDYVVDDRADLIPDASNFSDDHDDIRGQSCDEQRDSRAHIMSHLLDGFHRLGIALFRQPQNIFEDWRLSERFGARLALATRRSGLGVIANRRGVRSIHFPASAVAAPAFDSIFHDGDVSEFSCHSGGATNQ